jgi:[histone H3]-trimethyl-L-lysine4 demethylase
MASRHAEDRHYSENFSPSRLAEVPEAPVVYPTAEEFEDPCLYIQSLWNEGKWGEAGMIKIRPPVEWPKWKLRFLSENMTFEPRNQELHKLRHRSKGVNERFYSFVEQICHIQDNSYEMPETIEYFSDGRLSKHEVDLYQLFLLVNEMGGYPNISEDDWAAIANRLLLPAITTITSQLKLIFGRLFDADTKDSIVAVARCNSFRLYESTKTESNSAFIANMISKAAGQGGSKRLLRSHEPTPVSVPMVDNLPKISCSVCWKAFSASDIVQSCLICDHAFHAACFRSTFRPTWAGGAEGLICSEDCSYGFEQGPAMTLSQYRRYADGFKANWIQRVTSDRPQHQGESPVTWQDLESEFWRIVEEPTRAIRVMYGSDLDTSKVGSGFPLPRDPINGGDPIASSPWNLNIFPTIRGSLLKYLAHDINGISVPWLYCGSLFTSFCYHVEDLHMMSINYMHESDCEETGGKIWYSSPPGEGALLFEAALRSSVPRLFEAQPDLGHDIVTMVSPVELIDRGAKVYRTIQRPGEFVVTLPQSYHGGFSLGFNVGEAVNFFTPDCLPWMRSGVEICRFYRRQPVFCLTELLVAVAERIRFHADLTEHDAIILESELTEICDDESQIRWIVVRALGGFFDVANDIGEQGQVCSLCRQWCFLSLLRRADNNDVFCLSCVIENSELFPSGFLLGDGRKPYQIQYFEEMTTMVRLSKQVKRHRAEKLSGECSKSVRLV